MTQEQSSSRRGGVGAGIVAGIVGGLVASWAMERFQQTLARVSREMSGPSTNGDRRPGTEPATYKTADALSEALTGVAVPRELKPAAGSVVHYAFGAAVGALYGAAAARRRGIASWAGLPFGAAVWLVADEIAVPLAGLSKGPTEYPLSTHASALAAHLVYGATIEAIRRLVMKAA